MDEREELKKWLNDNRRSFDAGMMLYIAYINKASERVRLERTRDEGLLFNYIRDRFTALKETTAPAAQAAASAAAPTANETLPKEPGEYSIPQKHKDEWHRLKTEQERWHTEICIMHEEPVLTEANREKCATLAGMILNHEGQLIKLAHVINHYKLYGEELPNYNPTKEYVAIPDVSKLTEVEKVKLLASVRSNISKAKNKIEKKKLELPHLAGRALQKALKDIDKWENKLKINEAIKKELSNGQ